MKRRSLIKAAAVLISTASLTAPVISFAQNKPWVEVWKTPTCGCCHDWIAHMEENGFQVKVHDLSEAAKTAQRQKLGMPEKLGSCHTAVVNGYVLEGHVPARDIHQLLKDRPRALGLAVPGMPVGSPGMDGPAYGQRKDPFDVLLVSVDGSARIYKSYNRS